MTVFVALLRAVNVGGTCSLAMKDLQAICARLGFEQAQTYIQSGNAVFETSLSGEAVRTGLERALAAHLGKPVDVIVRTAAEMRAALEANPFPEGRAARVSVLFTAEPPPPDALDGLATPGGERVRRVGREVYVHYPDDMGRSKLKLPTVLAPVTARNLNTVGKLVALAEA